MTNLAILFWRFVRFRLRESYGRGCMDFNEDCIACRAGRAQDFITEHIALLEWEKKQS